MSVVHTQKLLSCVVNPLDKTCLPFETETFQISHPYSGIAIERFFVTFITIMMIIIIARTSGLSLFW